MILGSRDYIETIQKDVLYSDVLLDVQRCAGRATTYTVETAPMRFQSSDVEFLRGKEAEGPE
jgi:hypothetical protein